MRSDTILAVEELGSTRTLRRCSTLAAWLAALLVLAAPLGLRSQDDDPTGQPEVDSEILEEESSAAEDVLSEEEALPEEEDEQLEDEALPEEEPPESAGDGTPDTGAQPDTQSATQPAGDSQDARRTSTSTRTLSAEEAARRRERIEAARQSQQQRSPTRRIVSRSWTSGNRNNDSSTSGSSASRSRSATSPGQRPRASSGLAAGSTANPSTAANPESGNGGAATEASEGPGFFSELKVFLQENSTAILGILAGAFALSLGYFFLAGRRRRREEEIDFEDTEVEEIDFRQEEEDAPRRVLVDRETGLPKQDLPRRKESDYALVVEEDILHGENNDDTEPDANASFEQLVQRKQFDEAYRRYRKTLRHQEAAAAADAEAETTLGKHYLDRGDLDRAEWVLRHHLKTQPDEKVDPEIYFDLGYLYFKRKTIKKSCDYFRRYAQKARDEKLVERAQRVVSQMERLENLN